MTDQEFRSRMLTMAHQCAEASKRYRKDWGFFILLNAAFGAVLLIGAITCNVGMLAGTALSLGACEYGRRQRNHCSQRWLALRQTILDDMKSALERLDR